MVLAYLRVRHAEFSAQFAKFSLEPLKLVLSFSRPSGGCFELRFEPRVRGAESDTAVSFLFRFEVFERVGSFYSFSFIRLRPELGFGRGGYRWVRIDARELY